MGWITDILQHVLGIDKLVQQMEKLMATNQEILDEVAAQNTVANSVLVIVQRLVSENDPAVRQQIFDGLKANRTALDAAVVAGTPAAPPSA